MSDLLSKYSMLAASVRRQPGLGVPGSFDGFEVGEALKSEYSQRGGRFGACELIFLVRHGRFRHGEGHIAAPAGSGPSVAGKHRQHEHSCPRREQRIAVLLPTQSEIAGIWASISTLLARRAGSCRPAAC